MSEDNNIGTEAPVVQQEPQNASPDNVSKVEKMKEAFSEMKKTFTNPGIKESDLPEKGGTSEENEPAKTADLSEKQEDGTQQKKTEQSVNWEERYNNLQSRADKEASKAESIARKLIEKDPEYIHELAKEDKVLADRIVKAELGAKGINSYNELLRNIELASKPESERELYTRLENLEKTLEKEQESKVQTFLQDFRAKNPNFQGEVEQKTWQLYKDANIPFQEAYEYVVWKSGLSNTEKKIEEEVTKRVLKSNVAAAIPSSASKSGHTQPKKDIPSETKNFLEGIGAKKTLQKYN